MRLGRTRNGVEPVRRSARGADRCGPRRRPKPGRSIPPAETPSALPGIRRAPSRRAPRGTDALQATARGLPIRPVLKHGPRSLTCVRVDGRAKPGRRKEADGREPTPPSPVGVGGGAHRRPTPIFCEGFELEHACRDPKDGELCLSEAKPDETLVEARSDTDVQIVHLTWV